MSDDITVWHNARLASMAPGVPVLAGGAIAARGGRIAFAGPEAALPGEFARAARIDCEGRLITPGLIDCHTHLVFAGDRAREF